MCKIGCAIIYKFLRQNGKERARKIKSENNDKIRSEREKGRHQELIVKHLHKITVERESQDRTVRDY